jgi:hypothetical protein
MEIEEVILRNKGMPIKLIQEVWRECYGYSEYEVSNLGLVRRKKSGRILTPHIRNRGKDKKNSLYYAVYLKNSYAYIHRLVYKSFYGDYKGVVDHINGVSLDNRLVNLRELSNYENAFKGNRDDSKGLF